MSTAAAFLELKRFLTGIESTSQKLKKYVTDGDSSTQLYGAEGDAFVNSLENNVHSVQNRLDDIETNICGTIETRLSQVTMLEILQQCKFLHQANEEMVTAVEGHMMNYGYIVPTIPVKFPQEEDKTFLPTIKPVITVCQKLTDPNQEIQSTTLESEAIITDRTSSSQNDDFPNAKQSNQVFNSQDTDGFSGNYIKPNSIDENSMYNSPQCVKTPMARGSEHEVKTPALPDWKLSEATRMLVQNKDGKDGRDVTKGRIKQSYLIETTTPSSNTTLNPFHGEDNIPTTPSTASQPHTLSNNYSGNNLICKDGNGISVGEIEVEMLTPQPISKVAYNNGVSKLQQQQQQPYHDDGDSPKTPCLGTPFHTTRLRTMGGIPDVGDTTPGSPMEIETNFARTLDLSQTSPAHLSKPFIGGINNDNYNRRTDSPVTPSLARDAESKGSAEGSSALIPSLSSDSCDDLDSVLKPPSCHAQLSSPPKIPIMAPRPAAAGDTRPTHSISASVIQIVTEEEWVTAPAFLRKQVRRRLQLIFYQYLLLTLLLL